MSPPSARPVPFAALLTLALLAACSSAPRTVSPGTTTSAPASTSPTPSTPATTSGGSGTGAPVTDFPAGAPWPRLSFVRRFEGLSAPIHLTSQPSDPSHMLIVEKGGTVRSVRNGALETPLFLDISDRVSDGGEQGLLSIAFPPGPASAERVYACYTATNGDVVVSRFPITSAGAADASRERIVLRVPHHTFPNHNGGQIAFGPDGYLYVGVGDGGSEGDPQGNGQDLGVLLAKVLRIDVEGRDAGGKLPVTYTVPRSNPFVGRRGARPEIWASGLRNPWRFSFDDAVGDVYIGDVGQNAWEEIDFQRAGERGGADYGWSLREGSHAFRQGSRGGLTGPVAEYSHAFGNAVVGGYVYRGSSYPAMAGVYLFGDNGSGRVWGLRREGGRWRTRELAHPGYSIASFGEDGSRELYLVDIAAGVVYQVTAR